MKTTRHITMSIDGGILSRVRNPKQLDGIFSETPVTKAKSKVAIIGPHSKLGVVLAAAFMLNTNTTPRVIPAIMNKAQIYGLALFLIIGATLMALSAKI